MPGFFRGLDLGGGIQRIGCFGCRNLRFFDIAVNPPFKIVHFLGDIPQKFGAFSTAVPVYRENYSVSKVRFLLGKMLKKLILGIICPYIFAENTQDAVTAQRIY